MFGLIKIKIRAKMNENLSPDEILDNFVSTNENLVSGGQILTVEKHELDA